MREQFERSRRRGAEIGTRRARISFAGALILAGALVFAPAALAGRAKSINWAGYAVHRPGVSFRDVSASWIQPGATCVPGQRTYSAVWVGLGGYSPTSAALEQIGTEVDCTAAGRATASAWYELVPAPSRNIGLAVAPGDLMHADVTVVGHRVTVELDNLTQHQRYRQVAYTSPIDVSSAEWIVEAPSECISQVACQALPLADFGSVSFASASVTTTRGVSGGIANARWGRTRISLTPGAPRFIVQRTTDASGAAAPSSLRERGSGFDVTYASAAAPSQGFTPRQSRLRAGYIQH